MKQLRYLKIAHLFKVTTTKQDNGELTESMEEVGEYYVQTNDVSSEVDATVYGADIYNITRFSSVRNKMEKYLTEHMNFTPDNISLYRIVLDGRLYQIRNVKKDWVDGYYLGQCTN